MPCAHQLRPSAPAPHWVPIFLPQHYDLSMENTPCHPRAYQGWEQPLLLIINPVLISRARSGKGTSLLTWTPREIPLVTVRGPAEVLDELGLVQRCQQGPRALRNSGVRQQTVGGFAKGLSKLVVVLRDEAVIAEEETKEERHRGGTGRTTCFRAFAQWEGHGVAVHGLGEGVCPCEREGVCAAGAAARGEQQEDACGYTWSQGGVLVCTCLF